MDVIRVIKTTQNIERHIRRSLFEVTVRNGGVSPPEISLLHIHMTRELDLINSHIYIQTLTIEYVYNILINNVMLTHLSIQLKHHDHGHSYDYQFHYVHMQRDLTHFHDTSHHQAKLVQSLDHS